MNRPALRMQTSSAAALQTRPPAVQSKFPFYLVLFSLLLEFGRPQDMLGVRGIPLPSIIDTLIAVIVLVFSGKLNFSNLQTRLWIPLLALMTLHAPLATNNFYAAMTLKDMFLLFCVYLGIITYIDSFDRLRTLLKVWLAVHIVLAVLGIIARGKGIGGWLGDENDFCMELNVVIPFVFFALTSNHEKQSRIIYASILCLFVLAAMTTLSRGGFIGLATVGTYCWMRSSKKFGAILVMGLLIIFMIAFAPAEYWQEVQSITDEETMTVGTGGDRMYIWGIGWEMFLANPIIGVGQGNLPWDFEEYEAGRTFMTRSRAGRQAHSAYFTLFPELGLAGIGIFGAMIYRNFKDTRQVEQLYNVSKRKNVSDKNVANLGFAVTFAHSLEGSMVGYLVSSVFISTLYYPSFWIIMAFVVALKNAAVREYKVGGDVKESSLPVSPRPVARVWRPRPYTS
ncbi:MAG TPA: O-antigen ligase family protein [Nitrospiraceae bacterium]|nr:O-antigen ligase family protein [Nitrospiraceae bacterium]